MLKFRVFKITLETMKEGTFEFVAEGTVTETSKKPYPMRFNGETRSQIARDIVMLQKALTYENRLLRNVLIVQFPKTPEIHQPINSLSQVRFPLSDEEIVEFWRYLREWRDSHGDHC